MLAVIREPIHPKTAIIRRPSPGLARLLTSTRPRLQDAELATVQSAYLEHLETKLKAYARTR